MGGQLRMLASHVQWLDSSPVRSLTVAVLIERRVPVGSVDMRASCPRSQGRPGQPPEPYNLK